MRLLRIALHVGLFSIAALVVYIWMIKLSADLAWDEAWNFSAYASNPLKAISLYHEHNNHPLDSLIKSLFYSVMGLTELATLKITGFLFAVGYLALGWIAFRKLEKSGWLVGAALLVPLMLLTKGISYQAVELRGYFLSVALQAVYLLLVCRDTGLLIKPVDLTGAAAVWTRRTAIRYGALSALILWTLPSNILAMPPIWLLTAILYGSPEASPRRGWLGRAAWLVGVSAAFSLILYAPIILTLALKISVFHNTPARAVAITGKLDAMRAELDILVNQLGPRGIPAWTRLGSTGIQIPIFGVVLALFLLIGAVVAFRPGHRIAALGLLMIGVATVVRVVFAAFLFYPTRVRTALVPPLLFGILLIAWDLTSRWRPRAQMIGALLVTVAGLATLPGTVREPMPGHVSSEVTAFLKAYSRPESRNVLIVHSELDYALLPMIRGFGPEHMVGKKSEIDSRFRGEPPPPPKPSWKQSLRDFILPEEPFYPLDASKVDVLVFVDDDDRPDPASKWTQPVLDSIKTRLSKHSVFDRAPFHLHVWEAP